MSQDIESLTTFKRDSATVVKHLRKTGRPVVLTVKGKAHVVIMDPLSYQQMADRLEAVEAIRRGLAQAKKGRGKPVAEFFDELDAED